MAHGTQSLGVAALLGLVALAATAPKREDRAIPTLPAELLRPRTTLRFDTASRQLNGAAALLALAALADSAVEHYRGSFHNKTMYVPLGAATVTLLASLRDMIAPAAAGRSERNAVDAVAVATGIIGTVSIFIISPSAPAASLGSTSFMPRRWARRHRCRSPACCAE